MLKMYLVILGSSWMRFIGVLPGLGLTNIALCLKQQSFSKFQYLFFIKKIESPAGGVGVFFLQMSLLFPPFFCLTQKMVVYFNFSLMSFSFSKASTGVRRLISMAESMDLMSSNTSLWASKMLSCNCGAARLPIFLAIFSIFGWLLVVVVCSDSTISVSLLSSSCFNTFPYFFILSGLELTQAVNSACFFSSLLYL